MAPRSDRLQPNQRNSRGISGLLRAFGKASRRPGWVDGEHLRDLGGGRLVRLDGLHGDFGLQAGWVTLTRSGH